MTWEFQRENSFYAITHFFSGSCLARRHLILPMKKFMSKKEK